MTAEPSTTPGRLAAPFNVNTTPLPGRPTRCKSAAFADGRYGHVAFANSGAKTAQDDFAAGMALLHDFEYPAAAEAFRRAQDADPGFAMAYWGEAMTYNHPVWMQQDAVAARAALARLAPTAELRQAKAPTAREKAWRAAVEILYA